MVCRGWKSSKSVTQSPNRKRFNKLTVVTNGPARRAVHCVHLKMLINLENCYSMATALSSVQGKC